MSNTITYEQMADFWCKARKVFDVVCDKTCRTAEEIETLDEMVETFNEIYRAFKGFMAQEVDPSFDTEKFDEASGYTE